MFLQRAVQCILLSTLLAGMAAQAADEKRFARAAVRDVLDRIDARDCPGAIKKLNAGMAEKYPGIALLAGSMYENGVCLKQSWDSAMRYFVIAHRGGEEAAAYRLAAGYASPLAGPDPAAALWWIRQSRISSLAPRCLVDPPAATDSDLFIAALQKWTPARLAACNYVVGVMATVAGETQYPTRAYEAVLDGTLRIVFTPALPKIDVTTEETTERIMPGGRTGREIAERTAPQFTGAFERDARKNAERALARYPQPAGIDPGWQEPMKLIFTMQ
jgi:hypothetical protein